MWPLYQQQQRRMNPMGYPVSSPQIIEMSGETRFYNALEEYERTEADEKRARRKIVIGSLVIGAIILIGIRMFNKQTTI